MLLSVDLESEVALYIQLRNEIIRGIAEERIKAGESLPSVRQLAGDLGINMHTINKAYNILKQDGFLSVHRKQGVIVNMPDKYEADNNYKRNLYDNIRPNILEAICRGVSEKEIIDLVKEIYKLDKGV